MLGGFGTRALADIPLEPLAFYAKVITKMSLVHNWEPSILGSTGIQIRICDVAEKCSNHNTTLTRFEALKVTIVFYLLPLMLCQFQCIANMSVSTNRIFM